MGAPKIPSNYTHTVNATTGVSGSLDLGLDNIRINNIAPVTVSVDSNSRLSSDSKLDSKSQITSDNKVDLGLDNIRIKEIPRIALHPTRIHFPVNLRFGLNTMGVELLAFSVCGESMVIIEDYVPHKTEVCD